MESEEQVAVEQDPNKNISINSFDSAQIDKLKWQDKINIVNKNEISTEDNKAGERPKMEFTRNETAPDSNLTKSIKLPDVAGNRKQQNATISVGRFFSVSFVCSLESGFFNSVNDVYVKYSIVAGPDWIQTCGSDLGITQISRYRINSEGLQQFVWSQPISISYRSYNYFGWPQLILSVYHFDSLGNDQILGYGSIHLPITNRFPSNYKHKVIIYSPQSTSYFKQILSWFTRRKPELINANLFARGDCRKVLQTIAVGKLELTINLTTKDTYINGYRS